jgi:Glycosyl transferases group 1
MSRVIFFIDNEWAFGSIHTELVKQFSARGIVCQLLPWSNSYTSAEIQELIDIGCYFVSNPHGYVALRSWSVPAECCIVVAHSVLDLLYWASNNGISECMQVKEFAVVSNFLFAQSLAQNFPRIPRLCEVGVNCQNFKLPVPLALRTVGFASTYADREQLTSDSVLDPRYNKRGFLVRAATEQAGLQLKIAQAYHHSFVTMPGFYNTVDCVIVSSIEEGACLPALEAGAAGRLVISTPVGVVSDLVGLSGADLVSVEENCFISECVDLLKRYQQDAAMFRKRCEQILEHSKKYDWSNVIHKWVDLIL